MTSGRVRERDVENANGGVALGLEAEAVLSAFSVAFVPACTSTDTKSARRAYNHFLMLVDHSRDAMGAAAIAA